MVVLIILHAKFHFSCIIVSFVDIVKPVRVEIMFSLPCREKHLKNRSVMSSSRGSLRIYGVLDLLSFSTCVENSCTKYIPGSHG